MRTPAELLSPEIVLDCLHEQSMHHAKRAGTPGRWKIWASVDLACNPRKGPGVSLRLFVAACRSASRGNEPYEGLCCKQMMMPVCPDFGHRSFPVEGLVDSGCRIRTVLAPSWSVDFARLMVPVAVPLLGGCSVLALADLRDAQGIGSAFPVCVVALNLAPEQGTAPFENVALTGDEAT